MRDHAAIYVVGVDAGGTRSRFLLSGPDRREIAYCEAPAFSLKQQPASDLKKLITSTIKTLIPHEIRFNFTIGAIAVGAAGVGSPDEREMVQSLLYKAFHNTHIYVHHDAFIAQYGAFAGGAGIVVTSGTGSIAYGRNAEGKEARAGGWGWLLGDEGSGWWIAREAVRCALAQWEGSGPTTGITDLLIEHFSVADAYQLVPDIYSENINRDDLTALGQQLADLARQGDEVAIDLYHRAGKELAELALRTGNKLNIATNELEVALLGGVGSGALDLLRPGMTAAWEALSESEGSGVPSLVEPQMDAVRGAVHWARESIVRRSYA